MRYLGFSTGALAFGDFRRALDLVLHRDRQTAIELSALRVSELPELVSGLGTLDLTQFKHVSVHAPSRFEDWQESYIVVLLLGLPREWPIVVHPDAIHNPAPWRELGSRLVLENMDQRKQTGSTADEMAACFEMCPQARFCLDLAHARQIDPSMKEAVLMLKRFSDRLVHLHVSSLDGRGKHVPLADADLAPYSRVMESVPERVAVVIESINPFMDRTVMEQQIWIDREAQRVEALFRAS